MKIKNLFIHSTLKLTAKSWAVLNASTGEILASHGEHERREIASITKVMTAYTAFRIINNLNINVTESKVEASGEASSVNGTSAELDEGDVLSLWDMLHAMLLPSGNDAAYALAEYFGLVLLELGLKSQYKMVDPVQVFIFEMNKNAKALGMTESNFASPHGLSNCFNKSSVVDLAKLGIAAIQDKAFMEIVSKPSYKCTGQDMTGNEKCFEWINTNKLLEKGFNGLKTGITPNAGPCLLSSYQNENVHLIMIVLACKGPDHRWNETLKMKDWAVKILLKAKKKKEKALLGKI